MDIKKLISTLHLLERKVLPVLDRFKTVDEIEKVTGLKEVEVVRAMQWLENKKIITIKTEIKTIVDLDVNGKKYVETGLPEKQFLESLKSKKVAISRLTKHTGLSKEEVNICLGLLRKKVAIIMGKEKKELAVSITEQGKTLLQKESLEEKFLKKKFPLNAEDLQDEEVFALESLKKRKDIVTVDIKKPKTVELTEIGEELIKLGVGDGKVIDRLTKEIIKTGEWKKKEFRRYDVTINVPKVYGGRTHFVNDAIDYIKKIWLELGFTEMEGTMVQTAFWDLDSLFVPQDHPAREMQDTFYLNGKGTIPSLYTKIKAVHENGGKTGSKGWEYSWDADKSKEILLRTHTTVLSAQTLAQIKKTDLPAKFFTVGKVYRNETLDWKHLFEFNQVEGIVIDPKANLQHLFGYLTEFYTKMGFEKIRLKPAHFPYTEPSLEVEAFHPVKKEWVELGGAGIFRPEVVIPLLGEDIPVLAWGQGMERIITEYYAINDLRELYKNDLQQLKEMKAWIK